MKNKKVGILTWHYFLNFGSALQAYALKNTIESLGYNARIINYRNPKDGVPSRTKDFIRLIVSKIFYKKGIVGGHQITYPFLTFHTYFLKMRKASANLEWLRNEEKKYDTIICGSDQIWAPNILNPVYLLNTVPENIKRISYAASIGLNEIPNEIVNTYRNELTKFKAVSVRESKGKELLAEKCGITSQVVLDPTLLLSINEWRKIERKPYELKLNLEGGYIFCYFLNVNHQYRESVENYAKKLNKKIIGYSLNKNDYQWMTDITGKIGPQEFLWLIHNSETVITDSFHGTIFSLLNHKEVFVFRRFRRDDPICQNSRIEQLNSYFNLNDRIVESGELLKAEPMEYKQFEQKLSILRKESINFLKNALGE